MRFCFVLAACAITLPCIANSASSIRQCVFRKTAKQPGGLKFKKPTYIFDSPATGSPKRLLQSFEAFTVGAESAGGFVQLVATPGMDSPSNPNAGKIVGWGKLSDFDFQELRNCN